jgi:hypothetical protein
MFFAHQTSFSQWPELFLQKKLLIDDLLDTLLLPWHHGTMSPGPPRYCAYIDSKLELA